MKNLHLILFAFVTLLCLNTQAQELMNYQQPKDYELPPKLIPTVRKYWVSLPKDYDKSTKRYPVVFVFDGDEAYMRNVVLNTVDQMTNFSNGLPECIIVGLIQRNRGLDFGPLYAINDVPNSAKINGDKFLKFLKTELLPELDKNYRTQNFRVGIGHSLGALFLTHSFTQDPDFFNGVIAISPALELKRDSTLFANLKHTLSSKLNRPTYFWWASGTEGNDEIAFRAGSAPLGQIFKAIPNKSLTSKYIDLPGKTHSLTPLFSVPLALEFVFKDWSPTLWESTTANSTVAPEAAMASRTKTIKDVYGFEAESDAEKAWMFFKIGYLAIDQHKYDRAITYLKAAIQLNPNDAGYYRTLSHAYEKSKNYNAALVSIKQGIEKLDRTNPDYKFFLEDYEADLKRVQKNVAK